MFKLVFWGCMGFAAAYVTFWGFLFLIGFVVGSLTEG